MTPVTDVGVGFPPVHPVALNAMVTVSGLVPALIDLGANPTMPVTVPHLNVPVPTASRLDVAADEATALPVSATMAEEQANRTVAPQTMARRSIPFPHSRLSTGSP